MGDVQQHSRGPPSTFLASARGGGWGGCGSGDEGPGDEAAAAIAVRRDGDARADDANDACRRVPMAAADADDAADDVCRALRAAAAADAAAEAADAAVADAG
jgi:hypothetical protein